MHRYFIFNSRPLDHRDLISPLLEGRHSVSSQLKCMVTRKKLCLTLVRSSNIASEYLLFRKFFITETSFDIYSKPRKRWTVFVRVKLKEILDLFLTWNNQKEIRSDIDKENLSYNQSSKINGSFWCACKENYSNDNLKAKF